MKSRSPVFRLSDGSPSVIGPLEMVRVSDCYGQTILPIGVESPWGRCRRREESLMDRDESWQVITEQRLGLASLLDGLSDAEWEQPSLCAGWRVRDVAAHVAM